MILLLGGTSETAEMAHALVKAGFSVLVSQATGVPLEGVMPPTAQRRVGPLKEEAMIALIQERDIRTVVDCTHPYAARVRATAKTAAQRTGCNYFSFLRREGIQQNDRVIFAGNHEAAADIACSFGRSVLLTTGTRNLAPYVRAAKQAGVALLVRVLPVDASIMACVAQEIELACIIAARGPFSVQENSALLKQFNIGVLVTKDGGAPGGVREKLEAAITEGCQVIVVRRPQFAAGESYSDVPSLISALDAKKL